MVSLESLIVAYEDCMLGKKTSNSATLFALNWEHSLIELRDKINSRTYQPSTSVCFIVTKPCKREIFAAYFGDRVIHHWIALRMEPILEKLFGDRSFNCRKGKGQLYGVSLLETDIKTCSAGYTKDCWVMRLDISGMFMSINRKMLADLIDNFIKVSYTGVDVEDLRYLCKVTILHAPENDCEFHSTKSMWKGLSPNKSLFTSGKELGIPIGNLPSQHFANFLLDRFDKFLTDVLGFKHVGRYVDDFYIVDSNKQRMLRSVPKIRSFLLSLGLILHKKKFYIQHYTKGITFVGYVVKRNRRYVRTRTIYNFMKAIEQLNNAADSSSLESSISRLNSYFGVLKHCLSYNIWKRGLSKIESKVRCKLKHCSRYRPIVLKKRYWFRTELLSKRI